MAHSLPSILKRFLKLPTAPFHEYHVRAEIEAVLKDCPNVKMKRDKFGNLLVTYKNGKSKSKPTWVLCAHMKRRNRSCAQQCRIGRWRKSVSRLAIL